MRIEQFIAARLADDEAVARKAADFPYDAPSDAPWVSMQLRVQRGVAMTSDEHFARHDPARVLRQVAAMRAILADHADDEGYCSRCWDGDSYAPASRMFPCPTIRSLAFVWSDHPEFHQTWASNPL
ncbi:hypothetical protein FEK35_27475 [Nocardia cyriacigeorgica]|uniref:Uncharacterized protein n=1 Tax=Nocardia cyriacigeorgica TaxID=135487 RepID=A0A5R8P6Y3_9NOCA|nr:DUF6221 family protein [Nocardia cyriacigeorgica]TLF96833.1 hypothetical protein FEK35_27475 [Nocardia cyriacigeorgica]